MERQLNESKGNREKAGINVVRTNSLYSW